MDAGNDADHPQSKPAVVSNGSSSADGASVGQSTGLIEISELDYGTGHGAYMFRVAIPGTRNNSRFQMVILCP